MWPNSWPTITQLRSYAWSIFWFGNGGFPASSFLPAAGSNYLNQFQVNCTIGGQVATNTPVLYVSDQTTVTISSSLVWNGPQTTGQLSLLQLSQLTNCGFWAGIDQVSGPQLSPWVWTFQSLRPRIDNTSNCAVASVFPNTTVFNTWVDYPCNATYNIACLYNASSTNNTSGVNNTGRWMFSNVTLTWYVAYQNSSQYCPTGYSFDVPKTATQSLALQAAMTAKNIPNVWLKINDIDSEGTWVTNWSGVIPVTPAGTSWWNTIVEGFQSAVQSWPYILGGVILFFVICIPLTFFVCRHYKNKKLKRGFKEFNDTVNLEDK